MKVATERGDYKAHVTQWQRCRDVYAGGDAVKAGGARYLPALSGATIGATMGSDYAGYKDRAEFFGATGRTVDGLTGVVMRKPPQTVVPPALDDWLKDITLAGVTLDSFAQTAMTDTLVVGRGGILIDWSAPAKRGYVVWYQAESIINWRSAVADGDERLSLVVLKEQVDAIDPKDEFVTVTVDQCRVLRMVDVGAGDPVLEVSLWRAKETGSQEWELVAPTPERANPVYPERKGVGLDEIPFVFVGPDNVSSAISKPPLLDLVDTNLSHYRTSADLEHGAHFTGLPTPYVTASGLDPSRALTIGSGNAWLLPADARVGMLEFSGQGLGALEKLMDRKEQRMAILGARLLEATKRAAEAADTVRLRQSGDESVLKRIAGSVSQALTNAIQWLVWWDGAEDEAMLQATCQLNTSFGTVTATPADMQAWLLMVQAGRMSNETFYHLLTRAELTRPGVEFEEEEQAIAAGAGAEDIGALDLNA